MSVETESVAISTIMQGRTNEELFEAREMEERKQLMRDQNAKNQMKLDNPTLMEEYDRYSEASAPLDEILNMRAQDPKQMKAGQESGLVNSAFTNNKFFR